MFYLDKERLWVMYEILHGQDVQERDSFSSGILLGPPEDLAKDADIHSSSHSHHLQPIQPSEGTKDVPSGKGGLHRPIALEYAPPWNMRCRSPQT